MGDLSFAIPRQSLARSGQARQAVRRRRRISSAISRQAGAVVLDRRIVKVNSTKANRLDEDQDSSRSRLRTSSIKNPPLAGFLSSLEADQQQPSGHPEAAQAENAVANKAAPISSFLLNVMTCLLVGNEETAPAASGGQACRDGRWRRTLEWRFVEAVDRGCKGANFSSVGSGRARR